MATNPDNDRIEMNRQQMRRNEIDAVISARPTSVLLLSGYWPVAGFTLAVATADSTHLLTPTDELQLAQSGWADSVRGYELGSLKQLPTLLEAVEPPLRQLLGELKLGHGRIGFEAGPWVQPSPYAALSSFGHALTSLLQDCVPRAKLESVDEMLERLRLVNTSREVEKIRSSCALTRAAFERGRQVVQPGATEMHVAAQARAALMESQREDDRGDGFVFCMSGPNAAEAFKFYQQTGLRKLREGDAVLLHCNSHANGFWTDVTRTFQLGPASNRTLDIQDAIFAARDAALATICPGVQCAEVDRAARGVMEQRGLGQEFKHPLGHGVGFAAIDHNAKPRLHPVSPDRLEEGMVFNVEPAAYLAGQYGVRHCDVVACGSNGPQVLTDFLSERTQLLLE